MLFTAVPVAQECAGQSSPKVGDSAPNGPIPVGQCPGSGGLGICHVSACELKPAVIESPMAAMEAGCAAAVALDGTLVNSAMVITMRSAREARLSRSR